MRPYQKRKSRMSDVICRRADKHLTEGQLKDIAALIYDTDLYIYPAMFADRQEAETVLPAGTCTSFSPYANHRSRAVGLTQSVMAVLKTSWLNAWQ